MSAVTQRKAIDQRGSRPGFWEVFSQTAIGTTSLGSRPASQPCRGPTRPVLAGLERLVKAVSFLVIHLCTPAFIGVHGRSAVRPPPLTTPCEQRKRCC